ncbi:hypothetical protein DFH29DRAFT_1000693 [Suillus ampliporus]|nr:hypothetical protein DFH29DRAFT_1000693 [Suillus ampliporus]
MKMDSDKMFKKIKQKMPSLAIAKQNLHLSSEDEVFDILEPGHEECTYNNPLMDCSSMGECLDVLSAHDRWKDVKRLKIDSQTQDDFRSLDLGFPLSDDDWMTNSHDQPESDMLDMQFPTSSDDDRSDGEMLDLGFPPESEGPLEMEFPPESDDDAFNMGFLPESGDEGEPLDLGFDIDPTPQPANSFPNLPDVSDLAGTTDRALSMGFNMDPVHDFLDQSSISQPDPIGFVIQRAVGDLHIAMHQLNIDWPGGAMAPDEAFARQQVLECMQELLLACELISIPRLSM